MRVYVLMRHYEGHTSEVVGVYESEAEAKVAGAASPLEVNCEKCHYGVEGFEVVEQAEPEHTCTDCGYKGKGLIETFSHTEPALVLCRPCYIKRGNSVR